MKKVLLIGNGAREHVIAETFKRSPKGCELFVYGAALNPGIAELAENYEIGPLSDIDAIVSFAKNSSVDFAFVGPENPLADGVVDALAEIGVKSASPLKSLAKLESSKSFTRDLIKKYGIEANPRFRVFRDKNQNEIREWTEELGEYVVKSDGLMGGKGVKLSGEHLKDIEEGVASAQECISKHGYVVIEEKLVGEEFSLMSFCDGENIIDMPAVQDHKRAFEGDTGPNTGGMGSWSDFDHSLPFLNDNDIKEAHEISKAVADALFKDTGKAYSGIMYGGFIAVKNGVRLIEYNARFGDPEVMNVLPLLKSDFVEICEAIINGKLNEVEIEFEKKASVVKYLVPEGYPDSPVKNEKIEVGDAPDGVKTYYASVDKREDGLYLLGSRAIAFVGVADDIETAEKLAQSAVSSVKGPVFSRDDIGTEALIQKRINRMKELRA